MGTDDSNNTPGADASSTTGAEVEILRELLAVAAHDLSNPLQSLSVLLELAVDDIPAENPAASKIESSLTAAEQLRVLIRGIAEFARPPARSRRTLGRTLDACMGVCIRRFERQHVTVERDTADADALGPVPTELRVGALAVLLGVVNAAGHSGLDRHMLHVDARAIDDDRAELAFRFFGATATGEQGEPLAMAARYAERAAQAVLGTDITVTHIGPGELRFNVARERQPAAST